MRRLRLAIRVLLAVLAAAGSPLTAQLSPGDLSEPHAELEGSGNCLKCHEAKRGVSADLCLSCHVLVRGRVEAGLGLHSEPEYERCESCHIEHHGRDFELVWWGEEGEDAFDHRLTGYPLEGGHEPLGCRDCHKPGLLGDPKPLTGAGKNLERTYLGLVRETCLSCHADEHQGQFGAGACLDCHLDSDWKPAANFDHARTRYPLTGEHSRVECSRCHPTTEARADPAEESVLYVGIAHASCTDCHEDAHRGRLGSGCESCHETGGWHRTDKGGFDHGRTRFALNGAHARVECGNCHPSGRPMGGLRYQTCSDCHRDVHLGQLDGPDRGRGCEVCHTEERFVPSTVTLASHQETEFPLEGGHLATPCDACHQRVTAAEIPGLEPRAVAGADSSEVIRFRFATVRCHDCHEDPHEGSAAEVSREDGCGTCHVVASWRRVVFDHRATDFVLEGAHVSAGCGDCHDRGESTEARAFSMSGAPTVCSGCHADIHQGQFDRAGTPPDCGSCHVSTAWRPVRFDHERDSDFSLEGAHSRVACDGCHELEVAEGSSFIRYRPLPSICSDCHGEEKGE